MAAEPAESAHILSPPEPEATPREPFDSGPWRNVKGDGGGPWPSVDDVEKGDGNWVQT